jgi:hypothetical protein
MSKYGWNYSLTDIVCYKTSPTLRVSFKTTEDIHVYSDNNGILIIPKGTVVWKDVKIN